MPWTEAEKVDYLADPFRAWAWKNDEPWFPFDAEPPPEVFEDHPPLFESTPPPPPGPSNSAANALGAPGCAGPGPTGAR